MLALSALGDIGVLVVISSINVHLVVDGDGSFGRVVERHLDDGLNRHDGWCAKVSRKAKSSDASGECVEMSRTENAPHEGASLFGPCFV